MIKLYILYFVFGFYMLLESYSIWVFSAFNGGSTFITYLAMGSSAILFSTASVFSLHHIKLAAILGIVALIGFFHSAYIGYYTDMNLNRRWFME